MWEKFIAVSYVHNVENVKFVVLKIIKPCKNLDNPALKSALNVLQEI